LPNVDLKVFPQCSNSPIVSSVRLPLLSGLPAIFQVFLGVLTSFLHTGHLAIKVPSQTYQPISIKHFPSTRHTAAQNHPAASFTRSTRFPREPLKRPPHRSKPDTSTLKGGTTNTRPQKGHLPPSLPKTLSKYDRLLNSPPQSKGHSSRNKTDPHPPQTKTKVTHQHPQLHETRTSARHSQATQRTRKPRSIQCIHKTYKKPLHTNNTQRNKMKTLRISEDIHQKLTALLGELMAQTSKMQTYQDAITALINESVILPQELLTQTQNFIEENKQLGFTTREEFIRDAIRFRLNWLKQQNEYLEIPKEQYEQLNQAIKQMNTPYRTAEDFINTQIKEALQKHQEWKNTNTDRSRRAHRKQH
jgi:hypothetical protein